MQKQQKGGRSWKCFFVCLFLCGVGYYGSKCTVHTVRAGLNTQRTSGVGTSSLSP